MTRHTRNRQLKKINSSLAFEQTGCNIPIELSNKQVCFTDLDPNFKWRRYKIRNKVHNMILCTDSSNMYTMIHVK